MDYDGTYLPLQGVGGVRPKAPAVGAWQSPGYKGLTQAEAHIRWNAIEWYGLRTDGLVVVDCDDKDAANLWRSIDTEALKGWVRQTPRGFHFIYKQSNEPGTPDAPAAGVWPHIDIRAGRTSQIVYFAPAYSDLTKGKIRWFDPRWLPENFGSVQQDRSNDESWDEIPDGRGNNTMTAFAGAFRKQGMSPVKIAKCLGAINRIVMTTDPMPLEMILDIARSVGRYAPLPDIDIEIEE